MSVWPQRKLGEIVDFFSGYAWKAAKFSDDATGIPIIRIQNVDAVRQSDFAYWIEEYDPRFLIDEGDILLTLSGSFRVEVWHGPKALLNQRIVKVTPKKQVNKDWLLFALRNALAKIEGMGRHALVNNVALSDLRDMVIPLPPLDEQKRIAGILDQADALRTKRKQALTRLNQLGQAIFVEMFGDPNTESGWNCNVVELSTICKKITDGTHQAPNWAESGIPFLFVSNIRNQKIDMETKKFVSIGEFEALTKYNKIECDDVLYTCVGSYGHTAVVNRPARFAFQRHIAHIKPNLTTVLPHYLAWCLETTKVKAQADKLATGIAQKTVTLSALKRFRVPFPNMDAQRQFETRISKVLEMRDTMEVETLSGNKLFTALQHRAFRGEL